MNSCDCRKATRSVFIAALIGLAFLVLMAVALADPPRRCGTACAVTQAKPQTVCPIMGGKINRAVYADVEGYRVYACCAECTPKIKADPAAALKKIKANGEQPVAVASLCQPCGNGKGSAACKLACAKAKAKPTAEPPHIDTGALATLLRSGVPLVVLDARTGKWDDGRRIPGAKTLSHKATAKEAAGFIKARNTLVITYCSNTKCPASKLLAKRLRRLGYLNVVEYPKGIAGWAAAGQTVEQAGK